MTVSPMSALQNGQHKNVPHLEVETGQSSM